MLLWPPAARASSLDDKLRPERFTLPNGLEVALKARPGSGSIALVAAVKVGTRYETLRQRGLAHFVEHMIFEGTRRHPWGQLQTEAAARGAHSNAWTGDDRTYVTADLPPGDLQLGLKGLAEMLFESAFPSRRVGVTRDVILAEREAAPPPEWWWRLQQRVFGRNSIVATAEDYERELSNIRRGLRREDAVRFYKEQYVPNNVLLAVVGDFDLAAARIAVTRVFGRYPRGKKPPIGARTELRPRRGPFQIAISDSTHTGVWCGYVIPPSPVNHVAAARDLLWLAAWRAQSILRDSMGLTYSVQYQDARFADRQPGGLTYLAAACRHQDIPRVHRVMRSELARLERKRLSVPYLAMLKANVKAGARMQAQKPAELAWTLLAAMQGYVPASSEDFSDHLTPAGLQRIARRYFVPERFFVGYARPRKTPGERGTIAALFAAVSLALVLLARRRNRRLAPPPEHAEAQIIRRLTPRYAAANLVALIVYGVPLLAVFAWLPWRLSDWLFTHARSSADFALWAAWLGLLCPAVWALALSGTARRVTVSRDGLLISTWGFGHLLRPNGITAVEYGTAPLWMWDLRRFAFGGEAERWVRVRMKSGFTLWLALRDPGQFLRDAAQHLGESVVVVQEAPTTSPQMPPAPPEAAPADS